VIPWIFMIVRVGPNDVRTRAAAEADLTRDVFPRD
jgi:hypothetical protein